MRFIKTAGERKLALWLLIGSAIPPGLIESTLFGHVRGAFYRGRCGTAKANLSRRMVEQFFWTRLASWPTEVQMKLLRVLQEREIEPVGLNESSQIDVRVIAATNRQLDLAIQNGTFREDLFYRLNVVPIYLPPLRERKQDVRGSCRFFHSPLCG